MALLTSPMVLMESASRIRLQTTSSVAHSSGARNVIFGNNSYGVWIEDSETNNSVLGNYVGTDATGNTQSGFLIQNSADGTIGGTASGAGNVISSNATEYGFRAPPPTLRFRAT